MISFEKDNSASFTLESNLITDFTTCDHKEAVVIHSEASYNNFINATIDDCYSQAFELKYFTNTVFTQKTINKCAHTMKSAACFKEKGSGNEYLNIEDCYFQNC